MKIETLAVHSGNRVDPATGAVTLPIHLTTTFERGEDGGYPQGYIYARNSNPNRAMLEECLAALEGGARRRPSLRAPRPAWRCSNPCHLVITSLLPMTSTTVRRECSTRYSRPGDWKQHF